MKEVRFQANSTDLALIEGIVDRGMNIRWLADSYANRTQMMMDITAVHLNGTPLRLKDLLATDDFNFAHDLNGIRDCLDRGSGQLTRGFLPRFSRRQA